MTHGATVLGIDFGEARLGIAVGNTATATATPLSVVACRRGRPDWAAIEALVREWQPERIVLGLPSTAGGEAHPLAARIARFARSLEGRYRLPVSTIDERLSSFEAGQRAAHGAGDDALAAMVILETWLNEQARP